MAEMEVEQAETSQQQEEEEQGQPQAEQTAEDIENKAKLLSQGTDESPVDTTEDFLKVFKGKTEFDSWDEFTNMFEEFQRVTGSAYKPKSATSIEYANERRVKDKIPERFVYQTVKMVCIHYGEPAKRESSFRKPKKYVGLGCEAMVHLRYKQGSLNIVSCNLEHKNHALNIGNEVIRSVRSFTFSDEVDTLIAKVVLEHSPYAAWNAEAQWGIIVEDLQHRDARLRTVNVRTVKKRIRFLVDRYMSNSSGKPPLAGDELGIILYELAQSRAEAADNPPKRRGRKRKRPLKFQDDIMDDDDDDFDNAADLNESYSPSKHGKQNRTFGGNKGQTGSKDITAFLQFLQKKDEQDRRFRQSELDLRREELELHRKEMELQKNKFEFERVERQAHLDLLKAQLEAFSGNKPKEDGDVSKEGDGITEYTIVVNSDEAFAAQSAAE